MAERELLDHPYNLRSNPSFSKSRSRKQKVSFDSAYERSDRTTSKKRRTNVEANGRDIIQDSAEINRRYSDSVVQHHTSPMEDNYQAPAADCFMCSGNKPFKRLMKVRCGHMFHANCLDEYVITSYACPICHRTMAEPRRDEYADIFFKPEDLTPQRIKYMLSKRGYLFH